MSNMLEKTFKNEELGIELTSYLDNQQNVWFCGKDVAQLLGYKDTNQAIRKHVDYEDQKSWPVETTGQVRWCTFLNESGFYSLVLSSKLETAKKFKHWITSEILPSIRKYGYYKMFDNPNNKMFKIENEMDLHCKVVELTRIFYPNAIMVPGLGENQDTPDKRINSWKKGYMRGQPDLIILDYHKYYKGLCIEFKSPTNNYCVTESQLKMKEKYCNNEYAFILSNDYDKISRSANLFINIWLVLEFLVNIAQKHFVIKKTLNNHYKVIHRIDKNI